MYRRHQNNNRHFTATRSFTAESLAAEAKHTFEAKMTPVGGIQESIRIEVPIHTRDHKREHFCLVTYPKFKECKDDLQWTWQTTFARLPKCLDQEMKEYWDAIVTRDYNTNASKTQANFTAACKKLISESIPMEHPRNQIRDLLDNMQKPGDMTPTQLWHCMGELTTCCRHTNGTVSVPMDEDLKAKLIRTLSQSIKFELDKQNITANDDIADILRLADVCDEQYQAEHRSNQSNSRARGRGNRQDNDSLGHLDRSCSRSRAPARNRRDDNHNNSGGNNSGPSPQCRLPGHRGHLWKDCYQNPRGNNYRGGNHSGRGSSSRSSGGRGSNTFSNTSRSNSHSNNSNSNGNNRSESHHVAHQPPAPGAASAAGSQARGGAVRRSCSRGRSDEY